MILPHQHVPLIINYLSSPGWFSHRSPFVLVKRTSAHLARASRSPRYFRRAMRRMWSMASRRSSSFWNSTCRPPDAAKVSKNLEKNPKMATLRWKYGSIYGVVFKKKWKDPPEGREKNKKYIYIYKKLTPLPCQTYPLLRFRVHDLETLMHDESLREFLFHQPHSKGAA